MDAAPEDCMRCGACCFSESPRHVRVTGDDHARLGDDAERLVVWEGNQAFMRLATLGGESACGALVLLGDGRFACSIYARRPAVCRELGRGSPECLGEAHEKRQRADRALIALRR
jgi:Fe-S-cluster containining protein